jgi:hypothetical protein
LRLFGSELREQPYDYEQAFAQAPSDYRGWLFVVASTFLFRDRERLEGLAALALRYALYTNFVSLLRLAAW